VVNGVTAALPLLPGGEVGLPLLLGVLAAYHLGIGLVSVASGRWTAVVTQRLYGLHLAADPALRHATRMLGLYALALGTLLAAAAVAPREHRLVIAVLAGLQLARAVARVAGRRRLAETFGVQPRANAAGAGLLVLEAALLVAWLPG
jgi:hypothetical protein